MKDLSKFGAVKEALETVVAQSDATNGTTGNVYYAYFWKSEFASDKERSRIQSEIGRRVLTGTIEGIKELEEQLKNLPKPAVIMEWKLVEPIPVLRGTKVQRNGDKMYQLVMNNVDTLYIPENAVKLGLLEYEETKETATDAQGREAVIVKLKLKKGLIDVAAPIVINKKEVVGKRAIVTPISYKTLQIVGQMMFKERQTEERLYGFTEI